MCGRSIEVSQKSIGRPSNKTAYGLSYMPHPYYYCQEMKEDEMGGTFSTHGREEKCIQIFDWKT
jgi:hypothetical protein